MNPWVKFFDALLSQIPLVGLFSGYFLHPVYQVARTDGTPLLTITKQAAFFEGKFKIEKNAEIEEREEIRIILSIIMMLLLERMRG